MNPTNFSKNALKGATPNFSVERKRKNVLLTQNSANPLPSLALSDDTEDDASVLSNKVDQIMRREKVPEDALRFFSEEDHNDVKKIALEKFEKWRDANLLKICKPHKLLLQEFEQFSLSYELIDQESQQINFKRFLARLENAE